MGAQVPERQQRGESGCCNPRSSPTRGPPAAAAESPADVGDEAAGGGILPVTESSALLGRGGGGDPETGEQKKGGRDWDDLPAVGDASWAREMKVVLRSSPPLIVTFFLQFSINATSVFAVGRLGKQQLGAVALANMTAAMTCLAPFIGLATSLDTLCAQAYGDGRKHLVGLQCQRCFWFLCCAAVPVAVLWLNSEMILVRIVDAETARLASLYLRIMILTIPSYIVFETGKRILQAQGLFRETSYIILVVAPTNVFVNWLLVWRLGLGFVGAPIGVVVSRNLLALLLVLYIRFVNGSQCWGGFDRRAFVNWGIMVRLALPGMVMVLAEWFAFELITLLSSRFGTDYLAAQSAIFTIITLLYQIPFSVSVASSTRIAGLIGGGVVDSAKVASRVAVLVSLVISSFNIATCITFRWYIPLLLTSDDAVIAIVATALPVVSIALFWDGISAGAHGILRGIGKQSIGGPANIFGHYVIALPLSLTLAFYFDWKIKGMWTGITGGLIVVSIIEYFYILKVDWQKVATEARSRNALG
ncbi:MATE efflux family [Cordyceps militaris]|uniref:MATE efflux family n=1 Tax=Cordyceps militaris TaxID=73501 RepID=A0A2H4SVQ5_CORMI|nr:MATE efflux family [Cordyceps militaris]